MLAIDDEKLPPPTPATAATMSSVLNSTPGFSTIPASTQGTSSRADEKIVQLRPPNLATANVYGRRRKAPTAVGTVVSRNFCAGVKP